MHPIRFLPVSGDGRIERLSKVLHSNVKTKWRGKIPRKQSIDSESRCSFRSNQMQVLIEMVNVFFKFRWLVIGDRWSLYDEWPIVSLVSTEAHCQANHPCNDQSLICRFELMLIPNPNLRKLTRFRPVHWLTAIAWNEVVSNDQKMCRCSICTIERHTTTCTEAGISQIKQTKLFRIDIASSDTAQHGLVWHGMDDGDAKDDDVHEDDHKEDENCWTKKSHTEAIHQHQQPSLSQQRHETRPLIDTPQSYLNFTNEFSIRNRVSEQWRSERPCIPFWAKWLIYGKCSQNGDQWNDH